MNRVPVHPYGPPGDARIRAQMKAKREDRLKYDLEMLLYGTDLRRFNKMVSDVVSSYDHEAIRRAARKDTENRKLGVLSKMR